MVQYNTVRAVQLEGPMEAVNKFPETGSRVTHQAEARTPVQQLREVLLPVTEFMQSEKHIWGSATPKALCC
jgi:hypothetical protein